ncbi:MAG: acetyl-CoA carboxylase biotin carboxylase subunit [bacterium]|nr:acetyl-CoA carboxylase biotin carboxylase subunit [bacterium]
MFKKILIANRGEIALRIIRACKELDIQTVAVHSEADTRSLHVQHADESICVGPASSEQSYLNVPSILSACEITDAEAVHPGYGFLAENAEFADICTSSGIKFIGPSADNIRRMGTKSQARTTMQEAGVPIIPGSGGVVEDDREALKVAREIGFPVIVKASSGGGGKGMRVVHTEASLPHLFAMARAEAAAAFKDPSVYMERYLERPKHVEVQILADEAGNVIHLGERDCSIQRRHQKLIEESPSPSVNSFLRKKLGEAAVKAAASVGYKGAGTVEFILDADGCFYFMEMNTRIQVEHPVTEVVFGVDLIKEQIRIAAGHALSLTQEEVISTGHAIECRINAEDAETFAPCPGVIQTLILPGGPNVRVDTAAYSGCMVPPYYDSLIAKLIVRGQDRNEAIAVMKRALDEFVIDGIKTTISFHKKVLRTPEFLAGDVYTTFLEKVQL